MPKPRPPQNEDELITRANELAGLTLGEIANQFDITIPKDLKREKGWAGLLLEHALGATAGSRPEPDFPQLGIELKSIPINHLAKPLETTFVCVAPLTGLTGTTWQTCHLRHKLARVLWVPIIAERDIPVAERVVCTPFIWSPTAVEEKLLADDWQELTDMIVLGEVEQIHGKNGQALQLRPKAANSKAKTKAYDKHGRPFMTLPRGFYLKTTFTQQLISSNLRVG